MKDQTSCTVGTMEQMGKRRSGLAKEKKIGSKIIDRVSEELSERDEEKENTLYWVEYK